MDEPHIHKVHDGRGPRAIYCDGIEVKNCVYADTKLGIVKFYDYPYIKNAAGDGLLLNEKNGKITVAWLVDGWREMSAAEYALLPCNRKKGDGNG